jgi:hypothetical protein
MVSLSTSELAQMREAIEDDMPDTCDILQVTQTSDGAGGWSETWGTVTGGSSVPCRLDFPNPGRESLANANLTPFKQGIVSMAYDVIITTANRISIGGEVYDVKGVNKNQSWIGVKRVAVERVP